MSIHFQPNGVAVPEDVEALIATNAPVAVGVSGGKDSVACALVVARYLRERGHTGPKILVHADLGLVEWADSLPAAQRLAERIGWELHVVKRKAGGMMERWESRWASSMARYKALECVKVILPWSTPSMRFCTSELKNDPITAFLKRRFPKQAVLSVTGIRAQESDQRAKMPCSKPNAKLYKGGLNWNAIIHWKLEQVWSEIAAGGLTPHEAYTIFGASRVSCVFCIMSANGDLFAGLKDERNHNLYRRMCELELTSGFAFQGGKWLSSLRPDLIENGAERLAKAMQLAETRQRIEAAIPKHMEFTKGWPHAMPTREEAILLANVRKQIAELYGWEDVSCITADSVLDRYAELMREKAAKE